MTAEGDILDLLARHAAEIQTTVLDDTELPTAPELPTGQILRLEDLDRARAVLEELETATARVAGLRTRVAGELAGQRRRPRETRRRAPRTLNTTI